MSTSVGISYPFQDQYRKHSTSQVMRKYKRYNTLQFMREEQEIRHLDVYGMGTRNKAEPEITEKQLMV